MKNYPKGYDLDERTKLSHNKWVTFKVILGVVFLASGCVIYLLFRSKSLNIYQWCTAIGISNIISILRSSVQEWNISEFVKFSLPDGLYSASYILIIDAIWHNNNTLFKHIIISFVPIVAISIELLQYIGLAKGTFDIYDLICYVIPLMIFYYFTYNSIMFNKLKNQRL